MTLVKTRTDLVMRKTGRKAIDDERDETQNERTQQNQQQQPKGRVCVLLELHAERNERRGGSGFSVSLVYPIRYSQRGAEQIPHEKELIYERDCGVIALDRHCTSIDRFLLLRFASCLACVCV